MRVQAVDAEAEGREEDYCCWRLGTKYVQARPARLQKMMVAAGLYMLFAVGLCVVVRYSASKTAIAFSILSMLLLSASLLLAVAGSSFMHSTRCLSGMSMNSFCS